jgi:molybdate transport system regulatory protein
MKKHRKTDTQKEIAPGYHCCARIWIEKDGETFIGFGRVVLLENIAEHGSISAAAKAMKMSYKHAWDLVDAMNRNARSPLVVKSTGGKGGGGAIVTEAGLKRIEEFYDMHKRLSEFLRKETDRLSL